MSKTIEAGQNYKGLLVRGVKYNLLSEGYDYFNLSVGGKSVFVPRWITERNYEQEAREQEREYERE